MSYQLVEVIDFVRVETGYEGEITSTTTLEEDLWLCCDDHHEFMEEYFKRFKVDATEYLWYFHAGEEGLAFLGGLIFKPPYKRVKRIDISVGMLFDAATAGRWSLPYPEHSLPKHRYDVFLDLMTVVVFWLWMLIAFGFWVIWPILRRYLGY